MLKWIPVMKLRKKLSTKHFVFFNFLILFTGLLFLFGLYYILNIQYQKPQDPFLIGPITRAPKTLMLNLDQPDQDFLSYSPSIVISGKTAPVTEVLISTDSSDSVIESKVDGSFSTVLHLDEGVNRINAIVFDSNGESKTSERTVYYSKEKL